MAYWLRHINSTTTTNQRLAGVSNIVTPTVKREQATSLSQRIYEHKLAERREWDLVISANELAGDSNAVVAFLETFWTAEQRFYNPSTDTEVPTTGWIRVVTNEGRVPREYIRNHKLLPQIKLTLIEANR